MKQLTLPTLNLNFNISVDTGDRAMYLRISRAIRDAIKAGQLRPNEALPSARALALQLSVNRHTIMAAYQELIAEGWISAQQRKAYFVMALLPVETSLTVKEKSHHRANAGFSWRLVKDQPELLGARTTEYRYNFAGGRPDIALFDFKAFAGYLNDALKRPNLAELNYGTNQGYAPFITQVEIYLRRARSLTNKSIVVVNGSQEALFLLSRLLLKPGDAVAVEKLGYQPAWHAFKDSGAQLVGIRQDDGGMDPEHLEQMAQIHQLRLIYLTPLHQYPTTVTLSAGRRLQIYQIAARYQIPLIEDDYDHEFHYRCQPLAPMAADDPYGLVIYLSTFSKIMFPGIRVGFIATDVILAKALVQQRTITNHKPNVIIQDAIARWMADGVFERHLRKLTRCYERRRDTMVALLTEYQRKGIDLTFEIPDGGMAIWVKTNVDAQALTAKALTQGVFIHSENDFHLLASDSENRYLRLGFAGMNETMITEGLALLFL